jgi:hypothetical protein
LGQGGFGLVETEEQPMREKIESRNLVDIATVKVDKNLPQSERSKDFNRQLGDKENYECTGFIIHAKFPNNGVYMEDCLRGMKA